MEIRFFTHGSTEYRQAVALRDTILRKPLGLKFTSEELAKDIADLHLGLFNETELMACLTLTETDTGSIKMRQVAVAEAHQRKGLGRQLSQAAEEYARKKNFQTIFCHARKVAVPFYQKLGYLITSDEFIEVTIPHYRMEKHLQP